MNKKLLRIITLTLFLTTALGEIQNFLGINNTQVLHAAGNPPPPPPPPMPGQKSVLTRAILQAIAADGNPNDKQKVIESLKDVNKANMFFGLLSTNDNFENIRNFLDDNGFVTGTDTRKAFEEKVNEKSGPTPDTTGTHKKTVPSTGLTMAAGDAVLLERLISYLNTPENVPNITDIKQIENFLKLDLIKNLETQQYPFIHKKQKYTKDQISSLKAALEKRKDELVKEELAQEAAKSRQAEIDKSISQNVTSLKNLSPDNLDDFVATFKFPDSITDLTFEEKKNIITKSWESYTGFKLKDPHESKNKAIYYVIKFKIYDLKYDLKIKQCREFNDAFNKYAKTTDFDYYTAFFPQTTNLGKDFETIKTELNKINGTVDNIDTVLKFWTNLNLQPKATDLAKQLPQAIMKKLKEILTEAFLEYKITDTNKKEIKKIIQALFKDSEISDTLKTKLGIPKTIKKVEHVQFNAVDTIIKIKTKNDVMAKGTISGLASNKTNYELLLTTLGLATEDKPTVEQIFDAIKAYKAPETGAQPKPGPVHPTPTPASPLNQQLKTLKTNLTQLKGKLETLNTKLTELKVALQH